MPGTVCAALNGLRTPELPELAFPMPKTGRLSSCASVIFSATSPLSVLSNEASAFTVTDSVAAPISSGISKPRTWAADRLIPVRLYFLNPERVTDTEYDPTGRLLTRYVPADVVTVG